MKPDHAQLSIPLFTFGVIAAPSLAFSATSQPTDEYGSYLRVLWALCLVLALILALYALFKKRFSLINPHSTKTIKVIEIQAIGPRKSICLIEVRGKEYLIGVANESITLLSKIDEESSPNPQAQTFHDILTSKNGAV